MIVAREPILSVTKLNVGFASGSTRSAHVEPAVRSISFDIVAGEVLALVGESGSGKSVTASSITGLLPARIARLSGSIRFEGRELLELDEDQLNQIRGKGIGMIFQNPLTSLDPSFPIGDQLVENVRNHRSISRAAAWTEAAEWLDRVGIRQVERVLHAYPHELSGGMRQRAMIAMAALARPKLLIADEPTTALDATIQKQILDLLKEMNRSLGMAILIITHDFGVVSYMSDRVAVMKSGRIVEQGVTQELLARPAHPYTRKLIYSVPVIGDRIANPTPSRRLGIAMAPAMPSAPAKPARSSEIVLAAKGVSKAFASRSGFFWRAAPDVTAVEDIDLDIRRGEIYGLIGESGSGKSTLARIVGRLLPATAGEIRFLGKDISTLDDAGLRWFRSRFQFVFQDSTASLNPRRTIAEQLSAAPLRLRLVANRRQAIDAAVESLEQVGLAAYHLDRYPHEFSGGQRQRIVIARALAVKPEFVVLDEPTSAVDVSIQAQILNLLLALRDRLDLTYLFIGHNLPVIEFLCDRVSVMESGRLLETFEAEDLYANASHPSTRRLIDSVLPIRAPAREERRPA